MSETLDRKAQTKNESSEKEKTTAVQQVLAASALKNRIDAHKHDQHMMRMKGTPSDTSNPNSVDEETRMLDAHRMSSTSNFLNGELYSRVLAPSTSRSSSSSSSSESSASYESSKAISLGKLFSIYPLFNHIKNI